LVSIAELNSLELMESGTSQDKKMIVTTRSSTHVFEGSRSYLQGVSIISFIEKCKIENAPQLDYSIFRSVSIEDKRSYLILNLRPKHIFFFSDTEFIKGFKDICSRLSINHNLYIDSIHIVW